jgi:hypothetical protein
MLTEMLALGLVVALYVASFGVLALPKHWYRTAQCLFIGATILADARIIQWVSTSTHSLKMRTFWCSIGMLASTGAAIWFVLKVQRDIQEARLGLDSRVPLDDNRDLIDRWRRVITIAERKFRNGKEPGVSFAQIFKRQPEYVKLCEILSTDTLDALAKNDPAPGAVDPLKLMLARDISRAEAKLGLGLLPVSQSSEQLHLEGDKTRNAEPELMGRIECLNVSTEWNLEFFNLMEDEATPVDGCFIMHVNVWNESAIATTVSGFTLELLFEAIPYKTERMPVRGYNITRVVEHSAFREGRDRTLEEELTEFPSDIEITNTKHQRGWLRFVSRELPARAHEEKTHFTKTAVFTLCALDRKGQPQTIYKGTVDATSCGQIKRNNDDAFLFA